MGVYIYSIIVVDVVLLMLPIESRSCPTYTCKEEGTIEGNRCVEEVNKENKYIISKCGGNGNEVREVREVLEALEVRTYCDINSGRCSDIKDLLPGSKTDNVSMCMGGIWENGICRGRVVGEECSNSIPCDLGLYCSSEYICTPYVPIGSPCTHSLQCLSYAKCYAALCTYIGTLPIGHQLSTSDSPFLCATYYRDSKTYKCHQGPRLAQGAPLLKLNHTHCLLSYTGEGEIPLIYAQPVCGYRLDGRAYCKQLWPHFQTLLHTLISFSISSESTCPEPYGFCTMLEDKIGYAKAMRAACKIVYYYAYPAPTCIQEGGNYWLQYCYSNGGFDDDQDFNINWNIVKIVCSIIAITGLLIAAAFFIIHYI